MSGRLKRGPDVVAHVSGIVDGIWEVYFRHTYPAGAEDDESVRVLREAFFAGFIGGMNLHTGNIDIVDEEGVPVPLPKVVRAVTDELRTHGAEVAGTSAGAEA